MGTTPTVEELMEQLRKEREENAALRRRLQAFETQDLHKQDPAASSISNEHTSHKPPETESKRHDGGGTVHTDPATRPLVPTTAFSISDGAPCFTPDDGTVPDLPDTVGFAYASTGNKESSLAIQPTTSRKRKEPASHTDQNESSQLPNAITTYASPKTTAPSRSSYPSRTHDSQAQDAPVVLSTATASRPTPPLPPPPLTTNTSTSSGRSRARGNAKVKLHTPTTQSTTTLGRPKSARKPPNLRTAAQTPAPPCPLPLTAIEPAFHFAISNLCPTGPDPHLAAILRVLQEDARKDEFVREVVGSVLREDASTWGWAMFREFVGRARRVVVMMEEESVEELKRGEGGEEGKEERNKD